MTRRSANKRKTALVLAVITALIVLLQHCSSILETVKGLLDKVNI